MQLCSITKGINQSNSNPKFWRNNKTINSELSKNITLHWLFSYTGADKKQILDNTRPVNS